MVRLVLFDIDGTLIRTGGAGVKAFAKTFETEFKVWDGFEQLQFAGGTDGGIVRQFFSLHQVEPTPDMATGGGTLEELKSHRPDWALPDLRAITAREVVA